MALGIWNTDLDLRRLGSSNAHEHTLFLEFRMRTSIDNYSIFGSRNHGSYEIAGFGHSFFLGEPLNIDITGAMLVGIHWTIG